MGATRDMVREFHAVFGVKDEERPCVPRSKTWPRPNTIRAAVGVLEAALRMFRDAAADDIRAHRLALITEELIELGHASLDESAIAALDALCDLQYVLDGTVLAFGMDRVADEAFTRVHASNMSKLGAEGKPVLNEHGKVTKGPNYVPVNLEDLVR